MSLMEKQNNSKKIVGNFVSNKFRKLYDAQKNYKLDKICLQADIIDQVPDGIISTDIWGNIKSWNKGAEKIFGYSSSEVIGKNISFLHPEKEHSMYKRIYSLVTEKDFIEEEVVYQSKAREKIFAQVTISLLKNKKGSVIGVIKYIKDITTSYVTKQLLEKSEEKFHRLAENLNEIFFIADIEEGKPKLTYISPAYEEIRGVSISEVYEDPLSCMKGVHPDDYSFVEEALVNAIVNNGINPGINYRIYKKDNEIRWFNTKCNILKDDNGKPVQMFGLTTDITNLKLIEEKLNQTNERLHSLTEHLHNIREEERKRISREIHDELGQLLTAIKIDLSRLSLNPTKTVDEISTEIDIMLKLVDRSIKSVKEIATELRPGILDQLGLTASIDWQLKEFQARTKIKCKSNLEDELIDLSTDKATAMFRMFQETLTNIARHSGATEVKVSLKVINGNILLEIKDNGKGITADEINNPKSLGLIGMKERAYLIGGKLEIKGFCNKGTKVTIKAPNVTD